MASSSVASSRGTHILQALLLKGEVSVEELTEMLGVSVATVRRDLNELERQGLLRRTHGGAITVEPLLYEPFRYDSSFEQQERRHREEKRAIALAAAELIGDSETIALTAGTTTTQVARSIRHRKNITVVTNTVNVAMELSNRDDITVFVTGGFLRGKWFSLVGQAGIHTMGEMFVDIVFIGVNGIHARHGLTASHPDEAAINRVMVRQARRRVCLADHTKIGAVSTALICPTTDIHMLITDTRAPDEAVAPFVELGIEVRRV